MMKKGSSAWQEISVLAIQRPANPQTPLFQMSLSGVGMRNVFLLDIVTGNTWILLQIVSDTKDDGRLPGQLWVPVETSGSVYPDAPFTPAGAETPKKVDWMKGAERAFYVDGGKFSRVF